MSCHSERWKIKNGVRQGGVLSGLFFGVYINSVIDSVASLKYGCRLGIHDTSIIVYADDIVLLAPSRTGLQFLIDVTCKETKRLKLEVNELKSKFMLFSNTSNDYDNLINVKIDGKQIDSVTTYKYLGFLITSSLNNMEDITRARNKFYSEFNFLLRHFNFADSYVKLFLFKQYCLQIYGSELWFRNDRSLSGLKQFAVGYHKAIKKILGLSYHESNHYSCQEANMLVFSHYINKIKTMTASRLFLHPCDYFKKIFTFLSLSSEFLADVQDTLSEIYDIDSCFENDRDAILARIMFVQNHEKQLREKWDN